MKKNVDFNFFVFWVKAILARLAFEPSSVRSVLPQTMTHLSNTPKPHDLALPKKQAHNFIFRIIISPNFNFLALVVSEFLYLEKSS